MKHEVLSLIIVFGLVWGKEQCFFDSDCAQILNSTCVLNECRCEKEKYPYPAYDTNKNRSYCSAYKNCSSDSDCSGYNQACISNECRCEYNQPDVEDLNNCKGKLCNSDPDCLPGEVCAKSVGRCLCKYGVNKQSDIAICNTAKPCNRENDCNDIPNADCIDKECTCNHFKSFPCPVYDENKILQRCSRYRKPCYRENDCDDIPNADCIDNECTCDRFRSFPYPVYDENKILQRCSRYKNCSRHSDCSGYKQACISNECTCEYNQPAVEDANHCKGKSCYFNGDCDIDENCSTDRRCTCTHGTTLQHDDGKITCKRLNYCGSNRPCYPLINNAHCSENTCVCNDGYRALTNRIGQLTDCYSVQCSGSRKCGVYESCESGECVCKYDSETLFRGNTTCLGQTCSHGICSGDDEECVVGLRDGKSRCTCKYGTIFLPNRTNICKDKYFCTTDKECGINAVCSTYKCVCNRSYQMQLNNGKFSCVDVGADSDYCDSNRPCYPRIINAYCSENTCVCNSGYRVLTNWIGQLTDCYSVQCSGSRKCGVYESCESGECVCNDSETLFRGNTTCLGQTCSYGSCSGDDEECVIGLRDGTTRCTCKYGMIFLPNRTNICKDKYFCTTDKECGINAMCSTYKCVCYRSYQMQLNNGKFSCVYLGADSDLYSSGKPAWIVAVVVCTIASVMFATVGLVACIRRHRLHRQNADNSNPTPLPTAASSEHLYDRSNRSPSQAHSNPGYTQDDRPPPYDQPPSYEAVVKMTSEC